MRVLILAALAAAGCQSLRPGTEREAVEAVVADAVAAALAPETDADTFMPLASADAESSGVLLGRLRAVLDAVRQPDERVSYRVESFEGAPGAATYRLRLAFRPPMAGADSVGVLVTVACGEGVCRLVRVERIA